MNDNYQRILFLLLLPILLTAFVSATTFVDYDCSFSGKPVHIKEFCKMNPGKRLLHIAGMVKFTDLSQKKKLTIKKNYW